MTLWYHSQYLCSFAGDDVWFYRAVIPTSSTQIEGVSLYYYVHLLFLRFIFAVNWHCCVLVILLLLIIISIVIIIIILLLFSCIVPAFTETFCRAEILYTAYCVIYFYYWLKTYHIKCRWWPNIEWLQQVCLFVIIALIIQRWVVSMLRCVIRFIASRKRVYREP